MPENLVDAYIDYLKAERNASHYTQRNYRSALSEFEAWERGPGARTTNWTKPHHNTTSVRHTRLTEGQLRPSSASNVRWRYSAATTKLPRPSPDSNDAPEPANVMKIHGFMNRVGSLKNMPASWRDLFFPEAHELKGD